MKLSLIGLSTLILTAYTFPALAGFEWVPADDEPRRVVKPESRVPLHADPMPLNNNSYQSSSNNGENNSVMQRVVETFSAVETTNPRARGFAGGRVAPGATRETIVPTMRDQSRAASQQPVTLSATPSASSAPTYQFKQKFDVVEGFGNDIPMAMAMRQVVPASYSFSFANGVNPGANVSWNGGQPWDQVLGNMLAPLKVYPHIQGSTIIVSGTKPLSMNSNTMAARDTVTTPSTAYAETPIANDAPYDTTAETQSSPLLPMPGEAAVISPPNNIMQQAMVDNAVIINPAPQMQPIASNVTPSNTISTPVRDANTNRPAQRTRMIDQIYQNMQNQDIEMRMNETTNYNNLADTPQAQPMRSGRPYSIEPYVPPSYTPAERNAYNANDSYMGNKTTSRPQTWEANRGDSLKKVFQEWSRQEGINMVWNSGRDYTLSSNVFVNDTFKNAVKTVYDQALKDGQKPPMRFVDNPTSGQATTFIVGG